jgi:molybdopterin-guanine dinucleotide biosynthesis protein A
LAGLEAALFSAQGEWVWITSCDLPLLTADLGRELFARAQAGSCDALLCQVRSPEGALLVEPLCGLYRRELWSSAKQALDAGQRRVLALLEHPAEGLPGGGKADSPGRSGPPRETRLPRTEFLELEGPRARLVFNLNTPEDWNALAGPAGPREQRA